MELNSSITALRHRGSARACAIVVGILCVSCWSWALVAYLVFGFEIPFLALVVIGWQFGCGSGFGCVGSGDSERGMVVEFSVWFLSVADEVPVGELRFTVGDRTDRDRGCCWGDDGVGSGGGDGTSNICISSEVSVIGVVRGEESTSSFAGERSLLKGVVGAAAGVGVEIVWTIETGGSQSEVVAAAGVWVRERVWYGNVCSSKRTWRETNKWLSTWSKHNRHFGLRSNQEKHK